MSHEPWKPFELVLKSAEMVPNRYGHWHFVAPSVFSGYLTQESRKCILRMMGRI